MDVGSSKQNKGQQKNEFGRDSGQAAVYWFLCCELPPFKRQFGWSGVLLHAAGGEIHVPSMSWAKAVKRKRGGHLL